LITAAGLTPSNKEARRVLAQGGVSVDDEKIRDDTYRLPGVPGRSYLLRVGKRRFLNVVVR
jgi:tyrosyl-tRNA synthetase